ncbi:MAG: alpha/beta fold hydrolase [Sphingomicrobium sp.]
MNNKFLAAVATAAMVVAVPAAAQQKSLAEDAAAFGARPAVMAPDLSADGTRVIYLTPGKGAMRIAVVGDLMSGSFKQVTASDAKPENLGWCAFAGTARYVCRITAFTDKIGTQLTGFSRLFSIADGGQDAKMLGQRRSMYDSGIRQFDAAVVDWLHGDTGSVLMMRSYVPEEGRMGSIITRTKAGLGVDYLDVATLKSKTIEQPRDGVSDYMSDGRGNIRLMEMTEAEKGFLTGNVRYYYRTPASTEWKPLTTGYVDAEDYQPLAIDAASNRLYVLIKQGGRMLLHSILLDGSGQPVLVAENPRVDVDGVVRVSDDGPVIGYTFAEESRDVVYINAEYKTLATALGKALPNSPSINFIDASKDGRKLLLFAGSDVDPGRYYVFDRDKKALTPAMIERPELEGRQLAKVEAVSIPAPDGKMIPAYLTLPPGGPRTGLPAVVLPHGGPSSRDEWGCDWLPQFLAARGYAVLQPNYRGSAGYGDAWLNDNGFKNWATSIGDITASARWLTAKGIAKPDKLAILGWSYGGYAALQSAVTEPGLYKAVVAIAPVTDLAMTKVEANEFVNKHLIHELIGSGAHVAAGSPLQHPMNIVAPVLMFHGDRDSNVGVLQSQKMDAALKAAGKNSDLQVFEGLDHQLDDSDARTKMLARIGAFLDNYIGK